MLIVAIIRAAEDEVEIDGAAWEALIGEHPSLTHVPERMGINPFTKQPIAIPARRDVAVVMELERRLGMVERAQNGEPVLVVWAEQPADRPVVLGIAQDVASRLGAVCEPEHG